MSYDSVASTASVANDVASTADARTGILKTALDWVNSHRTLTTVGLAGLIGWQAWKRFGPSINGNPSDNPEGSLDSLTRMRRRGDKFRGSLTRDPSLVDTHILTLLDEATDLEGVIAQGQRGLMSMANMTDDQLKTWIGALDSDIENQIINPPGVNMFKADSKMSDVDQAKLYVKGYWLDGTTQDLDPTKRSHIHYDCTDNDQGFSAAINALYKIRDDIKLYDLNKHSLDQGLIWDAMRHTELKTGCSTRLYEFEKAGQEQALDDMRQRQGELSR